MKSETNKSNHEVQLEFNSDEHKTHYNLSNYSEHLMRTINVYPKYINLNF